MRKTYTRKPPRRITPPDAIWANNAATYEVLPPPYRGPGPKFEVGWLPVPPVVIEFEPIEEAPLPM